MEALGGCAVSKSEVSRICAQLDEGLTAFRERPLDDAGYPYVWFDATHHKVRPAGRIVSQATVIAVGVRESGEKSVLGLMSGAAETEAFWLEFCRSLVRRGLGGVQLVISDAHEGLRNALAQCFAGKAGTAATGDRQGSAGLQQVIDEVDRAPIVVGILAALHPHDTRPAR